jgi:hypothetical protein
LQQQDKPGPEAGRKTRNPNIAASYNTGETNSNVRNSNVQNGAVEFPTYRHTQTVWGILILNLFRLQYLSLADFVLRILVPGSPLA